MGRSLVTDRATGDWGEGLATFSADRRHRYTLCRVWDPQLPMVNFVMLNPSTADAFALDPTNRRCGGFARAWGFGGFETTNLFALRSTDPRVLREASDPVGPDNDRSIGEAAARCALVVVAWGTHGALQGRGAEVLALLADLGIAPSHLRRTRDGHPAHPLYLPADLEPMPYR
ncbi:MAG: DUF1643 domain-containing protein [Acidobacteria bacterium]|nr:DUF1643 domain-containing protein [Acidobacteriota bacterium]